MQSTQEIKCKSHWCFVVFVNSTSHPMAHLTWNYISITQSAMFAGGRLLRQSAGHRKLCLCLTVCASVRLCTACMCFSTEWDIVDDASFRCRRRLSLSTVLTTDTPPCDPMDSRERARTASGRPTHFCNCCCCSQQIASLQHGQQLLHSLSLCPIQCAHESHDNELRGANGTRWYAKIIWINICANSWTCKFTNIRRSVRGATLAGRLPVLWTAKLTQVGLRGFGGRCVWRRLGLGRFVGRALLDVWTW